jgi:phosphogluconate dehydratase
LIARIYPNGSGDVNQFHAAGGIAFTIATLLDAGLLHRDVMTVGADSLADHARAPKLDGEHLVWDPPPGTSRDETMLRPASNPFDAEGGMRLVQGNLGRGIFKTSAVHPSRWTIEAAARIFSDQDAVLSAFRAGELNRDVAVVVRFQGPRANGMPELHKLSPALGVLQDQGYRVALITDGRMSGASGKVPAAIHVSPEALGGGPLAKLRDGDAIRLCADRKELVALVDEDEWRARKPAVAPPPALGTGRELFALMRHDADGAERGASAILAAAGL